MNVLMIENLKGKTRSARISVISRVTTRTDPLIFICVHIEVAIAYSLVLLGFVLLPVSITEDVLWLTLLGQADSVWLATAMEACAVLAAGVVAPFYVCSGFSLYINRRTHLEAWDIDLHFRRMVDRKNRRRQSTGLTTDNSSDPHHSKPATPSTGRQDGAAPAVAASVIGLFLFVIAAIQPGDSVAADAIGVPDDQASHRLINDILDHRDFGSTITKQQLQVIERDEEPEESEPLDFDWEWLNWLIEFIKSVSNVALWIEWVLWGIITVLFAGLVYLVIRNSHHLSRLPAYFGFRGADASQVHLFDLDIAPQSLPDNIPVAATALLNSGRKREAMSLLYRGALSRLVHRYGMQITDSATERQCVDQVGREQPAGRSDVFSSLTSHWLQIAYGRTEVSDSRVTSLCEQWPMAFDSGRFDATEAPARGVS